MKNKIYKKMNDIIETLTTRNGTLLDVDQRAFNDSGLSSIEFIDLPFKHISHPLTMGKRLRVKFYKLFKKYFKANGIKNNYKLGDILPLVPNYDNPMLREIMLKYLDDNNFSISSESSKNDLEIMVLLVMNYTRIPIIISNDLEAIIIFSNGAKLKMTTLLELPVKHKVSRFHTPEKWNSLPICMDIKYALTNNFFKDNINHGDE